MNKNKYKPQIGTFSDYYKSKKRQSIKENSEVSIEVSFWDDALQYALDNLRMLGNDGDSLDWNRMVEKIKLKFSLLNIFDKSFFTDDSFVIAHVKDIVYHNYCADSYLSGDTGGANNYDAEELGAKAFVISKLADEVLSKTMAPVHFLTIPEDMFPVAPSQLTALNDCIRGLQQKDEKRVKILDFAAYVADFKEKQLERGKFGRSLYTEEGNPTSICNTFMALFLYDFIKRELK